jgi:hypothetical protein
VPVPPTSSLARPSAGRSSCCTRNALVAAKLGRPGVLGPARGPLKLDRVLPLSGRACRLARPPFAIPSRGVWASPRRTPASPLTANVLRLLSDRALRFHLAIKFSAKASDGRIASGRLTERSGLNANLGGPFCSRCRRCPRNHDRGKHSLSPRKKPRLRSLADGAVNVRKSFKRVHDGPRCVTLMAAKAEHTDAPPYVLFAVDRNPSDLLLCCR